MLANVKPSTEQNESSIASSDDVSDSESSVVEDSQPSQPDNTPPLLRVLPPAASPGITTAIKRIKEDMASTNPEYKEIARIATSLAKKCYSSKDFIHNLDAL